MSEDSAIPFDTSRGGISPFGRSLFGRMHATISREPSPPCSSEMPESGAEAFVLCGQGGNRPSFTAVDAGPGHPRWTQALPAGHSPYALVINPDATVLAYGTRRGLIGLRSTSGEDETSGASSWKQDTQGPVLATCFVGDNEAVFSLADGRLVSCHPDPEGVVFREICSGPNVFCALCPIGENEMAALTLDGEVFLLPRPHDRPESMASGPPIPNRAALVTLQWWEEAHSLVYPTASGGLAFCDVAAGSLEVVRAHRGPFYAMAFTGETLLTFGLEDETCHVWNAGARIPARSLALRSGIVSATALVGEGTRLFLVEATGAAGIYEESEGQLRCQVPLFGRDYRVVSGLGRQRWEMMRAAQRQAKARRILPQMQESLRHDDHQAAQQCHDTLSLLGFEADALEVKAAHAEEMGDVLAAIKHGKRWLDLTTDDRRNLPRMLRTAEAFEQHWCLETALKAYERIARIETSQHVSERIAWISRVSQLMTHAAVCIVQKEGISPRAIAEVAATLNEPLQGCYVLNTLDVIPCPFKNVSPECFWAKLEQVLGEWALAQHLEARCEPVWWLSRRKTERCTTVILRNSANDALRPVLYAVRTMFPNSAVPEHLSLGTFKPTWQLPPCIQRMLREGVTENQRVACFRLALHLKRVGLPYDLVAAVLREWAKKNHPSNGKQIITSIEVQAQTAHAFMKEYPGFGCADPSVEPYCDPNCSIRRRTSNNARM